MNPVRGYLRRELMILLDSLTDARSRTLVSVGDDFGDDPADEEHRSIVDPLVEAETLATSLKNVDFRTARSVVLIGGLNRVDDVYEALDGVARQWDPENRIISVTYNRLWQPVIRFARVLIGRGGKMENWIQSEEICNLFEQSDFEVIQRRTAVLMPIPVPLVSRWMNRWLSQLPILRAFSIFNVVVARPNRRRENQDPSVSIIVAARNEEGNIAELVRRVPVLASRQELIFVEGGSSDGTWNAVREAARESNDQGMPVRVFQQTGKGKGDAVRLGFARATGDILIILDADLSVPPEELTRFIDLLRDGKCEFANGSRLVYPMEKQAMRFLNLLGNRFFGLAFTFLLGQPVRDTLCGTKALWASDYAKIADNRSYFGDFDPFGDFDLLFGAARLQLRIRDVPVHYKERTYGATNISRFRHGLLLFRMTALAARKIRFV